MKITQFLYQAFMHPAPKVDEKRVALLQVLSEKMGLTYEKGKIIKEEGDLRGRFIIETGNSENLRKEMYEIEDLPYFPDSEIEKILKALEEGKYAIPTINQKTKLAEVLIGKNVDENLKKTYTSASQIVGTIITQKQRNENRILNDTESIYNTVIEKMISGHSKRLEEDTKTEKVIEPLPEMKVVETQSTLIMETIVTNGKEAPKRTSVEEEEIKQQKKKDDLDLRQELDEKAQMLRDEAQTYAEKKSDILKEDIA